MIRVISTLSLWSIVGLIWLMAFVTFARFLGEVFGKLP